MMNIPTDRSWVISTTGRVVADLPLRPTTRALTFFAWATATDHSVLRIRLDNTRDFVTLIDRRCQWAASDRRATP